MRTLPGGTIESVGAHWCARSSPGSFSGGSSSPSAPSASRGSSRGPSECLPGGDGRRPPRSPSGFGPVRLAHFGRAAACLLAAPLALLLPAAETAQAQASVKLVSNTGQGSTTTPNDFLSDIAQAFTTGSNSGGYRLTRVDLELRHTSGAQPTYSVSIHTDSSGSPGTSLGTLTNPSSLPSSFGLVQFTASGKGLDLAANTTYFVVVDATSGTANTHWRDTQSSAEDADGAGGVEHCGPTRVSAWRRFVGPYFR